MVVEQLIWRSFSYPKKILIVLKTTIKLRLGEFVGESWKWYKLGSEKKSGFDWDPKKNKFEW